MKKLYEQKIENFATIFNFYYREILAIKPVPMPKKTYYIKGIITKTTKDIIKSLEVIKNENKGFN